MDLNALLDWRIIAMVATFTFLWLRVFYPRLYQFMWNRLRFNKWGLLLALTGIGALMLREIQYYPYWWIHANWPTLPSWSIALLYGDTIHFRSLLFFGSLIILLWRKYNGLLPALAVGWFCIGAVELTFIPQHFIGTPGRFLGLEWYIPFVGITLYFLVIRKCFKFTRKFLIFFLLAIFTQYLLLLFYPFWILKYAVSGFSFVINTSVLPNPPIQTWIFWFLNHLMKTLFAIAFYFVDLVKQDH